MCVLTAEQQRQLDAQMAADPGLAEGLGPLLDGSFGKAARELVLRCLSLRMTAGWPVNTATLLALADALRLADSQAAESLPSGAPAGTSRP